MPPFDDDEDVPVYELTSWDLPGQRRHRRPFRLWQQPRIPPQGYCHPASTVCLNKSARG